MNTRSKVELGVERISEELAANILDGLRGPSFWCSSWIKDATVASAAHLSNQRKGSGAEMVKLFDQGLLLDLIPKIMNNFDYQ